MGAEVIRIGALYTQVCVPEEWTDQEVVDFTEADNPCGAFAGWHVIPDRIFRFQRYNEFAQGFLDGSLSFDDGYSAEDIRANVTAIVNLLAVAAQGEVDNLRKALRECIHGWDGHEWMDPNYDEWDRLAAPEMP